MINTFTRSGRLSGKPSGESFARQLIQYACHGRWEQVPQILHHFRIMTYPPWLLTLLTSRTLIPPESPAELSIRAASILAVEAVRDEVARRHRARVSEPGASIQTQDDFPSVMIDFFLWDLGKFQYRQVVGIFIRRWIPAKKVERGEEHIEEVETNEMIPAHRTRSIWY